MSVTGLKWEFYLFLTEGAIQNKTNIAISVICNEIEIILMISTKAAVKSFQLKI